MTMSSSDWGPRAKASHPLRAVDQRAMSGAAHQRSFVVYSGTIQGGEASYVSPHWVE